MIKRPNILRYLVPSDLPSPKQGSCSAVGWKLAPAKAFAECRNVVTVVAASLVIAGGPVRAQLLNADPLLTETVRLYGDPVISANPDLLNSTSNDAGPWGSKEFLYSFSNDVGPLGSPEILNSVSNDVGTGLKVRFSEETLDQVVGLREAVKIYGEPVISSNPDLLNSTANDYGPWGAKESLYSFTNDYGPIGSPDSLHGVSNEYGAGIKVQLADPALDLDAP